MEITGMDSSSGLSSSLQQTQQELSTDKDIIGAQVVTGSLDKLNTDASGKTNSSYEMQKKVLGAEAEAKGYMLNTST